MSPLIDYIRFVSKSAMAVPSLNFQGPANIEEIKQRLHNQLHKCESVNVVQESKAPDVSEEEICAELEDQIRDLAYFKSEADGAKESCDYYWFAAKREVLDWATRC